MNNPANASNPPSAQGSQPIPGSQTILVRAGSGRRFLTWLGWSGFLVCGLLLASQANLQSEYYDSSGGIYERFHSGKKKAADKIAIIDISGVIMEGNGHVKRQIDRVREDDSVKAIIVRVDSPGGTVTGSDYIYHHLQKLREEKQIPMVVSMGSMATSGGYYVSMAVGDQQDSIFAEPTTTTGSIGVIIPHYDISGFLARYDVKDDSIASHPRKQMLSMTRSIPPDQRQILQRYVDESFGRFKDIVKQGRPLFRSDDEALKKLATGEIFTASHALKSGLVDKIGFIEDAIERAASLADLNLDETRVVQYKRPPSLLEIPMLSKSAKNEQLSAILEMSTPRAYYLNTTIPPLVTTWVLNEAK